MSLCREPLEDKLRRQARIIFSKVSATTTEAEFEQLFSEEVVALVERLADKRVSEIIAAAMA